MDHRQLLTYSQLQPHENITWTPCFDDHKCARLALPLDYSRPDGPTTEIALLLRPATDLANYKGTIFLNPGGPGGSGTALMPVRGEMISKIVGPEFDLLGFDPRGVGATTPSAQCFGSDRGYKQWGLQSLYSLLLSAKETFGRARSREKVVADMCLRALGGNGKEEAGGTGEEWGAGRFMSTPYVATDMLKIVEKLGQEKLQYWGFVRLAAHTVAFFDTYLVLRCRAMAQSWASILPPCIRTKSDDSFWTGCSTRRITAKASGPQISNSRNPSTKPFMVSAPWRVHRTARFTSRARRGSKKGSTRYSLTLFDLPYPSLSRLPAQL